MSNQPETTPPREWKDDDVVGILREDVAKDSDILFRELLPEVQALLRGQAEKDMTPEQILLEKLQELKVELAFQHGNSLHECKACSLLREITGDDGTMEGISGKLISIASADKAESDKAAAKEGGK